MIALCFSMKSGLRTSLVTSEEPMFRILVNYLKSLSVVSCDDEGRKEIEVDYVLSTLGNPDPLDVSLCLFK